MTTTTAPPPPAPGGADGPSPQDVEAALRRAGLTDVDASSRRRAEYSTDASLYRVVPQVVAFPRSADEVAAAVDVARESGVPVVARGGGTSIAGNAVSTGVVLDTSRHLHRLLDLDVEARTAVVEPGIVLGDLQRRLAPHGLRFGPDPSSGSRAAIGGMIGNNACGSRALGYGRTDANVLGLHAVAGTGERLVLRSAGADRAQGTPDASTPATSALLAQLRDVVAGDLGTIRTELGRFGRQVSGYALEHLLPEKGFDASRFLVGSEGTLALLTRAELRLVRSPERTTLVVLGYRDMVEAAEAVPAILRHRPVACEGLDRRIVEALEQHLRAPVPALPAGGGWLLVELGTDERGATPEGLADLAARARAVVADAGTPASRVVEDAAEARSLWRIREDGAGLATRAPSGRPGHAGWEDTAVPPERLAAYLREFDALMDSYGLTAIPYGHFGDGCLHVRIDYPLEQPGREGVYREFVEAAAGLVASHGGSMSGEHGDGRARSELLHHMYSPRVLDLFAQVKDVFDPRDVLNPGVLVRPRALDDDLRPRPWPSPEQTGRGRARAGRAPGAPVPAGGPDATRGAGGSADGGAPAGRGPGPTPLAFGYRADGGSFAAAVHRCVGVGKCRADTTPSGGVMCPSYLATKDEKDSTRGRSRVLQEMVAGSLGAPTPVSRGWRSPEVHDALDLCLSCKGCLSDCPTGVDMATYKAEATHQAYKGRLRPMNHYVLGWLPYLSRVASLVPRLANGSLAVPPLARVLKRVGGIDSRRGLPRFARRRFSASAPAVLAQVQRQGRQQVEPSAAGAGQQRRPGAGGQKVVLWADSFTEHFSPEVGHAALRVLEHAGFDVQLAPKDVCCGLTLISTGQLDLARRQLRRTVRRLAAATAGGDEGPVPLVVLEPSCLAVLRHDASALLSGDPGDEGGVPEELVVELASRSRTLAEVLAAHAPDVRWPHLDGLTAVAQPHCHQHAVLGFETDVALLEGNGVSVQALGGCCGLAGNFGVERGHYEVSVAVARTALLPAVEAAPADAVVLADGFSCRTQLAELADRGGVHLAELLARGLEPGA
ncbi:FAD-binding and (Fe-S)-binding domain-containing protein [uncultured Pseudokineococcus sp.]|uniref:FAD-binding and (Fe-S)-binding domain-containing protein n=1 Tax=uncultured Pseudokineococcus sp. TaxID=1642928 RepID=UPI00261D6B0E|nr:FAD-binding and (Fe-S)-binding domain-containing protein [uncultured Pseudokineococcus sp.]